MLRGCARSDSLKSKSTFSTITIRERDVNLTRAESEGLHLSRFCSLSNFCECSINICKQSLTCIADSGIIV